MPEGGFLLEHGLTVTVGLEVNADEIDVPKEDESE